MAVKGQMTIQLLDKGFLVKCVTQTGEVGVGPEGQPQPVVKAIDVGTTDAQEVRDELNKFLVGASDIVVPDSGSNILPFVPPAPGKAS